ncbi:MAG TPA: ABC transporter permease [Steroidobacteraceae bacterium]|jgi:putative ABC transport system permease protein|nr:ABC transporter permease [Steroidobacteraceae bacterium]
MNFIRQFLGILRVSLSGVTERVGSVLTIIIGIACSVGVLVSMLALGTGAREQEAGDARPDRVVLNSAGAQGIQSSIPREEAAVTLNLPHIKKDANGEPIVVLESFVPSEGNRRVTGNRIFLPLIGITANVTAYLPEMQFTRGRMFQRGLHELIASNPCARQFTGFEMGDRRSIHGIDWTIVGHFDQGRSQQCAVFADVDTIMSTFSRNTYSQVLMMLQSPADYDAIREALQVNPTLHLEARREREAAEEQFKVLNSLFSFVSYFIGTIMAVGATLGSVNSLYAIVDARLRELATLRAIGFGSAPIVASILCESILLALPGALLGVVLAWALFNGLSVSPFGYNFQLKVTPSLAVLGVAWALGMGVLGGLLPALRAARVPVTTALRAG